MAQQVVFRVSYPLCGILDWGGGWLKAELERRTVDLWQGQPQEADTSGPWEVEVVPHGLGYTVSILVPAEPADPMGELIIKCATALAKDPASCAYWLVYLMQALEDRISPPSWRTRVLASLEKRIHRRLVTGHW